MPLMTFDAGAYWFDPQRAEAARTEELSRRRRSKRWPSHSRKARKARRLAPARTFEPPYTPAVLARAVRRAIVSVNQQTLNGAVVDTLKRCGVEPPMVGLIASRLLRRSIAEALARGVIEGELATAPHVSDVVAA